MTTNGVAAARELTGLATTDYVGGRRAQYDNDRGRIRSQVDQRSFFLAYALDFNCLYAFRVCIIARDKTAWHCFRSDNDNEMSSATQLTKLLVLCVHGVLIFIFTILLYLH